MTLVIERFDLDETVPELNVPRAQPSVRRGALPPTFPFLIDDETAEIVEPVLQFCRSRFTIPKAFKEGEWKKVASADAAVSDLKDWWSKLADRGIPWDVADDDLVAEWLIDMRFTVSGRTSDFLADATVKRRAATVSSFYSWAYDEGLVERVPRVATSRRLAKAKLHAAGKSAHPVAPRTSPDVHPIDGGDLVKLEKELGLLPSELEETWTPDPEIRDSLWRKRKDRTVQTSRDRLFLELGVSTGMRIDEIANLRADVFEDFECEDTEIYKLFELRITHTKGLVDRDVYIPYWLMREIALYTAAERRVAIAEAERIWLKNQRPRPWQLFVNPPGAGRHVGKRADPNQVERGFHQACLDAKLFRKTPKAKGTSQASVAKVVRHVFHDTRHVYAVMTYHALEDIGIKRPWIRIQKLLGHADVSTTIGTYLQVLDNFGPETLEALGRTYRAMRENWRNLEGAAVN